MFSRDDPIGGPIAFGYSGLGADAGPGDFFGTSPIWARDALSGGADSAWPSVTDVGPGAYLGYFGSNLAAGSFLPPAAASTYADPGFLPPPANPRPFGYLGSLHRASFPSGVVDSSFLGPSDLERPVEPLGALGGFADENGHDPLYPPPWADPLSPEFDGFAQGWKLAQAAIGASDEGVIYDRGPGGDRGTPDGLPAGKFPRDPDEELPPDFPPEGDFPPTSPTGGPPVDDIFWTSLGRALDLRFRRRATSLAPRRNAPPSQRLAAFARLIRDHSSPAVPQNSPSALRSYYPNRPFAADAVSFSRGARRSGTTDGRDLSPAEQLRLSNWISLREQLRKLDPRNPKLQAIHGRGWVPTWEDNHELFREIKGIDSRLHGHHWLPNQFNPYFESRGLPRAERDRYLTIETIDRHLARIHPRLNREWRRWIDEHPDADADEILIEAVRLKEHFDREEKQR